MRLLILTNSRYNFYNYRYDLWKSLKNEGFEVFVTFPTKTESDSSGFSNFIYLPALSRSFGYFKEYSAYRHLISEIDRFEIDVVLSFTPKMVLLSGFLSKSRVIGTLTGMGSIFLKGLL